MLPLLLIPLLLTAPARAHTPHDQIVAYVNAPDFTDSGRAWAITDLLDASMLLRSDDHGLHWDFISGPTMEDPLVDL